ncbi:MAG: Do family serine endopeptidase [Alphaproteobacteria bacterium]
MKIMRLKHQAVTACLALLLAVTPLLGANAQSVPQNREEISLSFAPLVKRTAPAVVNIYTETRVTTRGNPIFQDPMFRRFFGDMPLGRPRERVENSLGSGVIIDDSGLVITNHHVVDKATQISVVLADRREFPAELVISEERTDLAVLRIKTDQDLKFPTLDLANSDNVEVGDLVLAIGNPFGVGQTVTSGIISSNARTGVGITDFNFFLQTDAAINPGNSGGALINVAGDVVGINTAIFSRDGGSLGIGFAVPANVARSLVQAARSGKPLRRPWLGLSGQVVDKDAADALGLDRPAGVLIVDVMDGGTAAMAGIKPNDVITAVDGTMIDTPEELRYRIGSRPIGGSARVTVYRRGDERRVNLKLMAAPEKPRRDITEIKTPGPLQGATLANLSPALSEELGIEGVIYGVIILETQRRSTASRIGLRKGDILLKVTDVDGDTEIDSTRTARRLRPNPDGRYLLTLDRNGREITLRATLR